MAGPVVPSLQVTRFSTFHKPFNDFRSLLLQYAAKTGPLRERLESKSLTTSQWRPEKHQMNRHSLCGSIAVNKHSIISPRHFLLWESQLSGVPIFKECRGTQVYPVCTVWVAAIFSLSGNPHYHCCNIN